MSSTEEKSPTQLLKDYVTTAWDVVRHPARNVSHFGANIGAGIRLGVNAGFALTSGSVPTTVAGWEFVAGGVVGMLGANFRVGLALAAFPSLLGGLALWGPSAYNGNPWHMAGLTLYVASLIPAMCEPTLQHHAERAVLRWREAASHATAKRKKLALKASAAALVPFAYPRWWLGRVNNMSNVALGVQDLGVDQKFGLAIPYACWWWSNRLTARTFTPGSIAEQEAQAKRADPKVPMVPKETAQPR